jgi:hypothetical protein
MINFNTTYDARFCQIDVTKNSRKGGKCNRISVAYNNKEKKYICREHLENWVKNNYPGYLKKYYDLLAEHEMIKMENHMEKYNFKLKNKTLGNE